MDTGVFERYELKYMLRPAEKAALSAALAKRMDKDSFGDHTVMSLYYDTPDRSVIRRSMEKPAYKEKLRVRSYGEPGENSMVYVELKKKYLGVVYKRRVGMPLDEARLFLEGKIEARCEIERECAEFVSRYPGIGPSALIAYEREAFFGRGDESAVRVTFDAAVRYLETDDFTFEGADIPLLDRGACLMEVKLPGVMPLWLAHTLDRVGARPTSFSKYGSAYADMMNNALMSGEKELIYCA